MRQYRKQCSSSGEDIRCEVGFAALDSWNVNFVQRFAKETGIAPTDYCQEKRLHCPEIIRKLRRDSQIMAIEAPVGLLPSLDSFTPELFRQSIREREDGHPDSSDYAGLRE